MTQLRTFGELLIKAADAEDRAVALEQALAHAHIQLGLLETRLAAAEKTVADQQDALACSAKEIDSLRALLANCSKPPTPDPRPAFVVDPAFSPAALDDERRMWYDRLIATFGADAVTYPSNNDNFAGTGGAAKHPTYTLGYQTVIEIYALVVNAIGDPAVFAEINRLMSLIDEGRIIYTTDLEESYIVRLYAVYAYLLHVNQHEDAAVWHKRLMARIAAQGGLIGNNDLAQCVLNNLLAAWCLWLLTNEPAWRNKADALKADFFERMVIDAERGIWKHQAKDAVFLGSGVWVLRSELPPGFPPDYPEPRGAQGTDYTRYDLAAMIMLHRLGRTVFAPELLAGRVNEMYRGIDNVSFRMDGTDFRDPQTQALSNWNKGDTGWIISSFVLMGAWNDRVRAVSAAAWARVAEHERMPFVPAAQLIDA